MNSKVSNNQYLLFKDLASLVVIGASALYMFGHMYLVGHMSGLGIGSLPMDASIYTVLTAGFTFFFTTPFSYPLAALLAYSLFIFIYMTKENTPFLILSVIVFFAGQALLYVYAGDKSGEKSLKRIYEAFINNSIPEKLSYVEVQYSLPNSKTNIAKGYIVGTYSEYIVVVLKNNTLAINKQHIISINFIKST